MVKLEKGFIMKKIDLLLLPLLSTLFFGCNSKNPNHINILSLPGALIGSVIENASYDRKRVNVERYANVNYEVLKGEIKKGEGHHIDEILNLANVENAKFPSVKQQLKRDYTTIFHNVELTAEPIMHAFSRLYMPKSAKDKTMNGFTYTEAWKIVSKRVDRDFEILRGDVKRGEHDVLSKIADDLGINDKKKRESFLHTFDGEYHAIFVNPLVAGVMVHGG